jgi:hypothetical protein
MRDPAGQQLDRAIEIARKIAAAAPLGIRATRGSAHRALIDDQEAAIPALFTEWRRLAQSEDRQEYLQALREKRSSTPRADPCHRTFLRIVTPLYRARDGLVPATPQQIPIENARQIMAARFSTGRRDQVRLSP